MDNALDLINKSLTRVLAFYERHEITLGYRPSVGLSTTPAEHPLAYAEARTSDAGARLATINEAINKIMWRQVYEIELSDAAFSELSKIPKNDHKKPKLPTDIVVYPYGRQRMRRPALCDEVMRHEVWHLIEEKYGVLHTHDFITEGTATYAEGCDRPLGPLGIHELLYGSCAAFVGLEVEDAHNQYQAMLDPSVRDRIQSAFIPFFSAEIKSAMDVTLSSLEQVRAAATHLDSHPLIGPLKGKLNRESFLLAYQAAGAHTLVDELSSKDMTKMFAWFNKLGF